MAIPDGGIKMTGLFDSFQRRINYLRISITDRCNLRCIYCSVDAVPCLPRGEILSYEEIRRITQAAASIGNHKERPTGGEPLVRLHLSDLISMLSQVKGIDDISCTTNGTLLSKYADELKEAGLKRINVSLDTLRKDRFERITRRGRLEDVLSGIEAAHRAGLNPVKINMVVLRGINDDEIIDFARMSLSEGWHIRFIECMPFEGAKVEALKTVSVAEIRELISSLGDLEPCKFETGNGPAKYYRLPRAKGTIGFISPLSEPFCENCNRLRITADGQLLPCLLANDKLDLKAVLRNGANFEELTDLIEQAVIIKPERHYLREGVTPGTPMCQIGG